MKIRDICDEKKIKQAIKKNGIFMYHGQESILISEHIDKIASAISNLEVKLPNPCLTCGLYISHSDVSTQP